jgi:hypothetical protein
MINNSAWEIGNQTQRKYEMYLKEKVFVNDILLTYYVFPHPGGDYKTLS